MHPGKPLRILFAASEVVGFAKKHDLIVLSDLAYAEIYFGDVPTPSILAVEGAKEVAIEFTSMSKTYSMAGWRIGFAGGPASLIKGMFNMQGQATAGVDAGAAVHHALHHGHELEHALRVGDLPSLVAARCGR